jgi:predicted DNA-binding protein with PD1-like motif
MRAAERQLGRIFHLEFEQGDDFFREFNQFVKENNIRSASIFVIGALEKTDMLTGFRDMEGFNVDSRHFEDWRELFALGNISWPEKPPSAMGDITWTEPQPYIHLHMALSGGPGKTEEVLVGHLSNGRVKGMFADIYELV